MKQVPVKKNDIVVILSGEDKGKVGKVLAMFPGRDRVLVEGVNIIKKALRKSQDNPKGGIITKEGSIHISKVMHQERYDARRKKHGGTSTAAEA